ncbi:FlaD/FlaE family flagellar protein [Haloarchaeobius sp. TZWSO28]|uniref:FlaD/FlaE family flagellar protein n=1 Tax=Haloarchaeobius sp. TZWSO28 TaxID=3446119 RepID=UPI003EB6C932
MGLRDILADFLGSGGNQARGTAPGAGQNQQQQSAGGSQAGQGGMPGQGNQPPQPQNTVSMEDLDQEEQIETLEQRIDGMEEDLSQSQNQLDGIQGSQEQVADRIEDVNDTVRQLLGIYDQLTASANPFMEGGQPGAAMDEDAEGFGFATETDEPAGMPAAEEDDEDGEDADEDGDDNEVPVEPTDATAAEDDEDGDAVSFDDLKAEQAAESAVEADHEEHDDDGETVQTHSPEEADEPDNEIQVETTSESEESEMSTAEQDVAQNDREDGANQMTEAAEPFVAAEGAGSDATLPSLADTYATDIIVFEWLTDLVTSAGPAATLRAIAYYEEIGWISPAVKSYLEGVLSGPDLDLNVDPSRDPEELNAEDHAESYEYIMKLSAVQETMDDTGL